MGISVPALANPLVGVVIPGNDQVQATAQAAVIGWLGKRNVEIAPTPLNKDGVLTLSNCLAIADLACARGVVEARATAESVLVLVTQASGPKKKRDLQLSAYWISKNHEVVSVQRMCSHCTDDALPTTLDAMMAELVRQVPGMTGKVKVSSTPPGLLAMIDNDAIGVTPIDHDVTPGRHHISVSRDGKVVEERDITVSVGKIESIVVHAPEPVAPPPPPPIIEHHSRLAPAVMIGVGVAAIATGAVLYAEGGPSGNSFMYRDLRPPGIGAMAAGGAVAAFGAIWFIRSGHTSTPTVAVGPGHAYLGWTGRF